MNDLFLSQKISELLKSNSSFAVALVIRTAGSTPGNTGDRMIVLPTEEIAAGTIGGGAIEKKVAAECSKILKEKSSGKTRTLTLKYNLGKDLGMQCGGEMEVFVEFFTGAANPRIFIFGAGHIAQKLGPMASLAGLNYIVIDDREEFARKEIFPSADEVILSGFEDAFSRIKITENDFVVIVTYKHLNDQICLKKALETPARYIGMIGSKKKCLEIFKNLGINEKNERVYAPIGLNLGDGSPGEIAVSILSEIIKIKSGGDAGHNKII